MYNEDLEKLLADGINEPKPDAINLPDLLTYWRHYKGEIYQVIYIANATSGNDKYPITIVYKGPGDRIWSRLASDWHRSFTQITDYKPESNLACAIHGLDVAIEHLEHEYKTIIRINASSDVRYGFNDAILRLVKLKAGMTQHDNSRSSNQVPLDSNR